LIAGSAMLSPQPAANSKKMATRRQAEILELVADGLSDKQIARRLGLSTRTVRTHLEIYFRRSRQHNRIGALRAYQDAMRSALEGPTGHLELQ